MDGRLNVRTSQRAREQACERENERMNKRIHNGQWTMVDAVNNILLKKDGSLSLMSTAKEK